MSKVYIAFEVEAESSGVPEEDVVGRVADAIAALELVGINVTRAEVQDWWA